MQKHTHIYLSAYCHKFPPSPCPPAGQLLLLVTPDPPVGSGDAESSVELDVVNVVFSLFSGARPNFGFAIERGSETARMTSSSSAGGAVEIVRNSAAALVSSEERSSLLPSKTPIVVKQRSTNRPSEVVDVTCRVYFVTYPASLATAAELDDILWTVALSALGPTFAHASPPPVKKRKKEKKTQYTL